MDSASEREYAVTRFLAPVALVALVGCHDTAGPERTGPLWVLGRPTATDHDTVDTQLPGNLLVAVYDSAGKQMPNALVSIRGAFQRIRGDANGRQ